MEKLCFTISNSFKNRRKLKIVRKKKHKLTTISDLSLKLLKKELINYIALDFDGVLAAHGQILPSKRIKEWLLQFCVKFPEKNIFILSNKPTAQRKNYFKYYFPEIRFIDNVRKKPYPDGLLKIKSLMKCQSREIALIDDRILTGCLACILAGSYPILITNPFINYKKKPFQEGFFGFLRWIEKTVFVISY